MAGRSPTLALVHMLDAIELLSTLLAQTGTVEALGADWRNRAAAERMVEITSEASRRLPPAWLDAFPHVPWKQIAGIGNVLRHEYDRVSLRILVDLTGEPLETLRDAVELLLDRERPGWRDDRERLRSSSISLRAAA